MRVFIYACEDTYQGLHGICDMRVVDVSSLDEANEYGMEMSGDVIDSFDTLGDFEEELDEDELDEAFMQSRLWYVYPIDEEKAKDLSTEELDKLAAEWGEDYFIEKYCGKMF